MQTFRRLNDSYFDCVPVELLHGLFEYFLAHELLYSFRHVSDYLDEALRSYSAYRWNFQSIGKCEFDLVCRHIHPAQVISLVLPDDNDTPGLPRLFLSRFRIEQFVQLRALSLISTDLDSSISILSQLDQLSQLRSLTINTPFDPEMLGCYQSQLTSLDICFDVARFGSASNFRFNRLNRLRLEFTSQHPTMNEMAQFLANLPALKHFELVVAGSMDLFDGNRWKILTQSLRTFHFQFSAPIRLSENILQSFRTPFWLEEKQWFVAYQDFSLFSVPRFTPKHIDLPRLTYIRSTASDPSFLHNYLNRIETLELRCFISLETIASILNVHSIKHLSVRSFDDLLRFVPLKDALPQLRQLSIKNDLTLNSIPYANDYRMAQIHKLEISIYAKQSTRILDKLSILFPCVHQLTYRSLIHSKDTIIHSMDRFPYLVTISFPIDIWFYRREANFCQHQPRVCGTRIVDIGNDHLQIHYWIEQQITHSSSMYSWLQLRHYWDRFKRLLHCIFLVSIYDLLTQFYHHIEKCSIPLIFISLFYSFFFTRAFYLRKIRLRTCE